MDNNTRKHPIGRILSEAAHGQLPAADELDAIGLSVDQRSRLTAAARKAVDIKAEGAHDAARAYAYEHAFNLIADLPEERQDPDFYAPGDPLANVTDPAALAAAVPRW